MSRIEKISIIGVTILVLVLLTYLIKPFKQFSNSKNIDVINLVNKTFISSDFNYAIKFLNNNTFRFTINSIENKNVINSVVFDDSFVLNDGSIFSKDKELTFVIYSSENIYSLDYRKSLYLVDNYEK